MSVIDDIIHNFAEHVRQLEGIENVYEHEPQTLPRQMPCVTLMFVGCPQDDVATGPTTEVNWSVRVNLYITLGPEWENAQNKLKVLVPLLLGVTRADPTLGGAAEWSQLTDEANEPVFSEDGFLIKSLNLLAQTTEE